MSTADKELSSTEAALRLGVTEGTLRNWRSAKPRIGPRPTYKGKRGKGRKPRVVYMESVVAAYLERQRSAA